MAEWDPDARLNDLAMEFSLDGGDQLKAAGRIFKENAAMAASSIVHAALYSGNEKVRLDAAKYVVERTMGKIGDTDPLDHKDPWEEFMQDITKEVPANASAFLKDQADNDASFTDDEGDL